MRGLVDFVNADLDVSGNDNLPRIPPLRYGTGLSISSGILSASVDFVRYTEQDNVALLEQISEAYNDLSAYVGVDIPLAENSLSLFLSGKNLTDSEQRNHTSFIKEFAPAPGRTVEAGIRLTF